MAGTCTLGGTHAFAVPAACMRSLTSCACEGSDSRRPPSASTRMLLELRQGGWGIARGREVGEDRAVLELAACQTPCCLLWQQATNSAPHLTSCSSTACSAGTASQPGSSAPLMWHSVRSSFACWAAARAGVVRCGVSLGKVAACLFWLTVCLSAISTAIRCGAAALARLPASLAGEKRWAKVASGTSLRHGARGVAVEVSGWGGWLGGG